MATKNPQDMMGSVATSMQERADFIPYGNRQSPLRVHPPHHLH
jgi:hypothetical protein